MATEDRELGPFKPAPDMLILAEIERAICHGVSDVWIVVVGEHLGFERTAHNTRRLRRQLEHLGAKHRWTASSERYGRKYWSLTPAGRRHLTAARKAGRVSAPRAPASWMGNALLLDLDRGIECQSAAWHSIDSPEPSRHPWPINWLRLLTTRESFLIKVGAVYSND